MFHNVCIEITRRNESTNDHFLCNSALSICPGFHTDIPYLTITTHADVDVVPFNVVLLARFDTTTSPCHNVRNEIAWLWDIVRIHGSLAGAHI